MEEEILSLGANQIPYFRTDEFSKLMIDNESLYLELINAPKNSSAVFITGSGTAAMDAAVSNVFSKNDLVLVVNGGSFGQRFIELCDVYKINYIELKLDYGEQLTKEKLNLYNHYNFTGILINMHETSTGVLYDMKLISDYSKKNNSVLVVDAISSFISDEIDMDDLEADIVITGSQKALSLPPGISLIALSQKAKNIIRSNESINYYLNLKYALENQKRGQTPFTPAVSILIQLNKRLNNLKGEGIKKERDNIIKIANDFRSRISKYPFKYLTDYPSNSVTSILVEKNIDASKIFTILKNEYKIFVVPSGGELKNKIFRVGHIGNLTTLDNDKLITALDDLKKRGLLGWKK